MKFQKGEIVFLADIGHKVIKCHVVTTWAGEMSDKFSVKVFHEGHNHEVYVCPKDLYFSKRNAQRRVNLNKKFYALRVSDLAEKLTDDVLSKKS